MFSTSSATEMSPENSRPESPGHRPRPVIDDLAVVIPTLGRPILEESLSRFALGDAWPGCLIIVDQGRRPEAASWVAKLRSTGMQAKYVSSEQRGRSAGINCGLAHVRQRFVAVTDDDCFVDRNWASNMFAYLERQPDAIVTGRVEAAGDEAVEFCAVTSTVPMIYRRPQLKVHPLIGGNMGVSLANAARIGPFDEHPALRSAEDSDWGYRALRLGIPILYAPEIVVTHFNWRSPGQRADRYRDYARSQGGFYGKHLLHGDGLIALQAGRDLVRGPIRWLRGLARRDDDMIARGRADTLELLPGIVAGLRASRRA
jgi:GT2 family glycosyltransferase